MTESIVGTGVSISDPFPPNWLSVSQPALLPLTTDYFPSEATLLLNYNHSFYTLTLPEARERQTGGIAAQAQAYADHNQLMQELVRQRLSQDFQIVEFDSAAAELAVSPSVSLALGSGETVQAVKMAGSSPPTQQYVPSHKVLVSSILILFRDSAVNSRTCSNFSPSAYQVYCSHPHG